MAKRINNPEKGKAWNEFSRYVRVRDCLKTTGLPFVGFCITCEKRYHIAYLQAGHCIPGRTNAKLFDKNLTHAQCRFCNEVKHGEQKKYEAKMVEKYGKDEFEQMKVDANRIIPDRDIDFVALRAEFKKDYETLMREHGYKTWLEMLQSTRS